MADLQRIRLKIGTLDIPLNVNREEEPYYREAERLIKERYAFYTTNYPNQSSEMYYTMTMLDIAVMAQRTRHSVDLGPITDRLETLLKDLDKTLQS